METPRKLDRVAILGLLLFSAAVFAAPVSWGLSSGYFPTFLGCAATVAVVVFGLVPWGVVTPPLSAKPLRRDTETRNHSLLRLVD